MAQPSLNPAAGAAKTPAPTWRHAVRLLAFDSARLLLLAVRALRWFAPLVARRLLSRKPGGKDIGVRLRLLFTAMGAAYIKLGQYLAIRYDLLAPETCAELSKLMDEVPAEPFATARQQIERELGAPLKAFFREFCEEPLAAASIAQVYRAVALDGSLLAVKVQRAAVQAELAADFRNLRRMARLAARLRLADAPLLVQVIDEFHEFSIREINFIMEAHALERIGAESPDFVRVPRVRWDLTTERVLSMELIEAVSLLKVCRLAESGHADAFRTLLPGLSPERLLRRLTWACLHQQFVTGRYHGDPHPGNLMIDRTGRIIFLDFGICGELGARQRRLLLEHMLSLTAGDFRHAFATLEDLVVFDPDSDVTAFRKEVIALFRRWRSASSSDGAGIGEKIGVRFQLQMMAVMRVHHIRIRANQVLFWRSQAILDATIHRLSRDFDLLGTVSEFLESIASDALPTDLVPTIGGLRRILGLPLLSSGALEELERLSASASRDRRLLLQRVASSGQGQAAPTARAGWMTLAAVGLALLVATLGLIDYRRTMAEGVGEPGPAVPAIRSSGSEP